MVSKFHKIKDNLLIRIGFSGISPLFSRTKMK